MAKRRTHTVAAVVPDGAPMFEVGVVCEVFGLKRSELADPWYDLLLCGVGGTSVRTQAGFVLEAPHPLTALRTADTVVVCPGDDRAADPELLAELRAAHRRGARIASICTGAFTLAEAGLLDGRRATTHWMHAADLANRYPQIEVQPDVLYVEDGGIYTSAGTASGVDLCLHLVRLDHGAEVANALARRMVVPPHRDGGQAQYVQAPLPRHHDDGIGPLLDWALEHLADPLSLDDLAQRGNMSTRTLARRFHDATGNTPLQWLHLQRIRRVQQLLESTDLPIEQVASRSGFGTAANLRQHFARTVGVSPQRYRRTFRGRQQELRAG